MLANASSSAHLMLNSITLWYTVVKPLPDCIKLFTSWLGERPWELLPWVHLSVHQRPAVITICEALIERAPKYLCAVQNTAMAQPT